MWQVSQVFIYKEFITEIHIMDYTDFFLPKDLIEKKSALKNITYLLTGCITLPGAMSIQFIDTGVIPCLNTLTHWGRVTHICVINLIIIASDHGLSPGRHQAIIWNNAGTLLIRHLGTNFSEILKGIHTISFRKMHLKMSSVKWRPFCFDLKVVKPFVC